MGEIVPLLFYKGSFGIKKPTNVDIPLNKETKINKSLSDTIPKVIHPIVNITEVELT